MKINKETLRSIAHLARLELPKEPAEQAKIMEDLQKITSWMEVLQAVDTEGIEPLSHVLDELGEKREDVIPVAKDPQNLVNLAPAPEGEFFTVPKVLARAKGKDNG